MFDQIVGNMGIRGNPIKKTMHVNFNIQSAANCYRKRDGRYVWTINIFSDKAIGVKIDPFDNMDWSKFAEAIGVRTSLIVADIDLLIDTLKNYKFESIS